MASKKDIQHDITVLKGIRTQCDEHFANPKSDWFAEFDIAENMFKDRAVFDALARCLSEFASDTIGQLEKKVEEA